MPTFSLIQITPSYRPSWWEDGGDRWINPSGGYNHKISENVILETVEVDDFMDLDFSKTGLLQPDSDAGWLSPEGRFFGCSYALHDALATYILKQPVRDLELKGWIRVAGAQAILWCERHPTAEQRNWASDRGHTFEGEHEFETR